jgi:hypothetical protein
VVLAESHNIFFISDRTGITAETLGRSLLSQFRDHEYKYTSLPFVDTDSKLDKAMEKIRQSMDSNGLLPVIFSTLTNPEHRQRLAEEDYFVFDFFGAFLSPLQDALQQTASPIAGQMHGMTNLNQYLSRMDAVAFTLNVDDGLRTHDYEQADIILLGVSRSGKTPTCLYLAMQFGIKAANYPLVEDDLEYPRLPQALLPHRDKLYGLYIDPATLHRIRQARRPDSRYASIDQCRREVKQVELMYRQENIPTLDSSSMSVEELATSLLYRADLHRLY